MIAELYIVAESFENNSYFSSIEVEEKIKALASDFICIRKYKETNRIYINTEIYNVRFINNILLSDLLFNPQIAKLNMDRDTFNALQKIVIESQTTTISSYDVIQVLLNEHNEELCHGLIAFNQIIGVEPEFQLIYNLQGWYEFRRFFLGIYPKNANFFIDECEKYFPKLFFHERNRTTISSILNDCPKKIVYHLAALNDKFFSFDRTSMNRTQILHSFSVVAGLDETASLEGNAERKNDFTFQFLNSNNEMEFVCCEPHLKLCYCDNNNNVYSNNRRIYFHEGKQNIQKGNILIGHIGTHL